ncbi:MAG: hypothetical protein EZS28_038049 [Streblomastix strix]|uniref:Uncharacterized protein n=1 Tax=Streblomastix strix TaxID=222440 RepID=A0A5J4U860_9EUKA|nr:MAG: hypothetical protein EZS28_038049 [Streblomastix strix]
MTCDNILAVLNKQLGRWAMKNMVFLLWRESLTKWVMVLANELLKRSVRLNMQGQHDQSFSTTILVCIPVMPFFYPASLALTGWANLCLSALTIYGS